MPNNQNQNNANTNPPNNTQPPQTIDKTTGNRFLTEKNLKEILDNLNANIGNDALQDIIDKQKEAMERLEQEIKDKNNKIDELEKQINDLLLQQPVNPNDPNIGNTLVELKKQINDLKQELALKQQEHEAILKDLEANTNFDNAQELQIKELEKRIKGIEDGLDKDFILNDILKDPIKAQEIIKELLKNPHNFPPFNLNPLVDANSDIFAQVRETLNTGREILRLLSTLDYVNNDFQNDVAKLKEEVHKMITDILNKRDEALKQLETLIGALEQEIKDLKTIVQGVQKDLDKYQLLKDDMEYYHNETYAYFVLCDDYTQFCVNIKNDCITLRDDMKELQLDVETIKEQTRKYRDEVEFFHTSLINMGYDKLVAKINQLEAHIHAMAEEKREQVLRAISSLGDRYLAELKEYYLDYNAYLKENYILYMQNLEQKTNTSLEDLDDKLLDSLDKINISTLSSLASLQKTKEIALDLIKHITDEHIEELTHVKTDYMVELQDTKTDAINSINENFAASGKGFMAELARINNELLALKQGSIQVGANYITEHITSSQTWTTKNDNRVRNYFILMQGASGYDNSSNNGGVTSFGSFRSVNGGLGNPYGRGNNGESAFFVLSLHPNTSINISIGTGRSSGYIQICHAE